jgi:hypothetical protein
MQDQPVTDPNSCGVREHQTPTARGLGPFTGRQLTAMVVALLVVVGFPVGAFAVTGSSVFITDHTSGAHASVDSSGNLATSAVPRGGGFVAAAEGASGTSRCDFFAPPAGKAAVVTSIDLVPLAASSSSEVTAQVQVNRSPACTNTVYVVDLGEFASDAPSVLPLNPGLTIANGHNVSLNVLGGTGFASVEIYGYYVPASVCSIAGYNCL